MHLDKGVSCGATRGNLDKGVSGGATVEPGVYVQWSDPMDLRPGVSVQWCDPMDLVGGQLEKKAWLKPELASSTNCMS